MSRPEESFDFKKPDYDAVFRARAERLKWLRSGTPTERAEKLAGLREYYSQDEHAADWITDWVCTIDPRNAEINRPVVMPFILWPKQREFVQFVLEGWRKQEGGLIEKSRDQGISVLSCALAVWLCTFHKNISIGFGSRKLELVDHIGDPKCLFHKIRFIMAHLPSEWAGEWDRKKHAPHKRIVFPATDSTITGEGGDDIGRGDRCSIYFVDEACHLEHPEAIDAALSATTNCRVDLSSVKGTNTPFAIKRHSGKHRVLTMHWRTDPRRDEEWYARLCAKFDPVTIAQEYDINYSASVEGVIIPSQWVQAAIDAHVKLGIKPTGARESSFDVADRGVDKNAWAARHGILLTHATSWSGKESDIYASVQRAFQLCDEHRIPACSWDGDGMGAGVRGDARKINETRMAAKVKPVQFHEFRGSAAVRFPTQKVLGPDRTPLDRTNEDYYTNLKSQSWHALRFRFQQTWRALNAMSYDPDDLISIDSRIPELSQLTMELSQPVRKENNAGKLMVDKLPDGALSPNLADAVMMLYAPTNRGIVIPIGTADRMGARD